MRRYGVLVAIVLAQGAIGGIQYALGVPEVLVALHVLGAAAVTVAAAALWAGTVERPSTDAPRADSGPARVVTRADAQPARGSRTTAAGRGLAHPT